MTPLFSRRAFVLGCGALPVLASDAPSIEGRVAGLLRQLTLEEKAGLCHGNVTKDKVLQFQAAGVPRLKIGQIKMLDGRQGIRPLDNATQTTSLPCTLSLSCTWDPAAAQAFSRVLAEELLAIGQHVLLAPCMNLMRSPLGGRNFENLGEDPLLAGLMASAYIKGAQDLGVAGCSAILVANDFEARRHYASSNMDERTLREMHLLPFELSITEGHVWTMMTANNLLNGVHCAQNRHLVQELVKDKLGFDGVMLTDWRAAYDTVPTALAGTDMTTGFCAYVFGEGHLLKAVQSGKVPEKLLDEKARRVLRLCARTGVLDPEKRAKGEVESPRHRAEARRLAAEGMVLLKNEGGLLPLGKGRVLVCGPAATTVPFGGGSGAVRPPFQITPLEGMRNALGDAVDHVEWAKGGGQALFDAAAQAQTVLFFAQDPKHGEGTDRKSLDLSDGQAEAIGRIAAANRKVAVVLLTGGAVSLEPWADRVTAILAAWYAGQSTGDAIADVLTGKVNPGGKLSFTIGKKLEDYACHAMGLWPPRLILDKDPGPPGFSPDERKAIYAYAADYKEGVFMGYRWFDEKRIEPRYAFGHGLSYTTFEVSGLEVKRDGVACTVKNTGSRAGAEVVQVYVAPPKGKVARPVQELRGFRKVWLKAGAQVRVDIPLRRSAFAYFDEATDAWKWDAGRYEVRVGVSSRDIRLRATVDEKTGGSVARY